MSRINKRNYIIAFAVMSVLMILFYRSFYWPQPGMSKRKILEIIIIAFGILIVPLLCVFIPKVNEIINNLCMFSQNLYSTAAKKYKKIILWAGVYVLFVSASYVIELVLDMVLYKTDFNLMRFYIVLAFNTIVYACILLRKTIEKRPEYLFLIVALSLGITTIAVSPAIVGVSWDDQIHYRRTLSLANSFNGISYEPDKKIIDECEDNSNLRTGYAKSSREDYQGELNSMYDNHQITDFDFDAEGRMTSVAYIPSAIGIILARGLGLSYTHIFQAGRLFNLITYALLFFFAIRKMKYSKILLAVIGLIPTSVFMASSYSYDSWLIGFIALGFSFLFSSMYEDDEKKCKRDIVYGIVAMTIGCFVKAVYFPLIITSVSVIIYNSKDRKMRLRILGATVLALAVLVASTAIPMLLATETATDSRGGTDVNAVLQIKYILSNPVRYTGILLRFLKGYLSFDNMSYFTFFAYMGNGRHWGVVVVTLFVLAFLDRDHEIKKYKLVRLSGIIMAAGCMIIVPTALYAAFTAVGADTILGCQYRYILPVLFPALYLIAPDGVSVKYNRWAFNTIPMIIISLVIMSALNELCANMYLN